MVNLSSGWIGRSIRRLKWGLWYEYVGRLLGQSSYDFLNFGYAPAEDSGFPEAADIDEADRYFIALYHRVAGVMDLSGLKVLEVSCGRGGGARYIYHNLNPARLVGIDRSLSLVEYCRKRHESEGLRFFTGDAEALEFAAEGFDVILNVEASHAYGSRSRFYREALRVLRPGGYLLTADFSPSSRLETWRAQILRAGFEIAEEEDMTAGVLRSLRRTTDLRLEAIRDLTPSVLFPLFRNFAGAQGSRIMQGMERREIVYLRFALEKPA